MSHLNANNVLKKITCVRISCKSGVLFAFPVKGATETKQVNDALYLELAPDEKMEESLRFLSWYKKLKHVLTMLINLLISKIFFKLIRKQLIASNVS